MSVARLLWGLEGRGGTEMGLSGRETARLNGWAFVVCYIGCRAAAHLPEIRQELALFS